MKKTRLQNISEAILKRLKGKKNIQEEQAYILFDGIIDSLKTDGKDAGSDEERTLSHYVNEIWRYRAFTEYSKETSFLVGGVWGAMTVKEMEKNRKEEDSLITLLISKYDDYYWFFDAIAKSPGIKHKNLASRGKKSPSELSQFVARMESENLITYSRVGREKYYYLQERGKRVYEGIQKSRKGRNLINTPRINQIVKDNNRLTEPALITRKYTSALGSLQHCNVSARWVNNQEIYIAHEQAHYEWSTKSYAYANKPLLAETVR